MGFNYQVCMYSSINLLNEASENFKWMVPNVNRRVNKLFVAKRNYKPRIHCIITVLFLLH